MLQVRVSTFSAKQLVFSNIDNEFIQLAHPRLWMQRICKRVGLPILSPHALRHTFATLLFSKDVNIKFVSILLGHSSAAFTIDVYADVY
ncbi:tyrosine-type recombinase/integrase [Loigolactobacillus jiayinensis]|uniref:Tyrosine-type recombinase/integrase n=1 Tax=Loigolactobacillus jiayinensis TaxID=2486016 RepID=A0ABW1RED5_9LACO